MLGTCISFSLNVVTFLLVLLLVIYAQSLNRGAWNMYKLVLYFCLVILFDTGRILSCSIMVLWTCMTLCLALLRACSVNWSTINLIFTFENLCYSICFIQCKHTKNIMVVSKDSVNGNWINKISEISYKSWLVYFWAAILCIPLLAKCRFIWASYNAYIMIEISL